MKAAGAIDRGMVEQFAQFAASVGKFEFIAKVLGGDPDATSMIDRVAAEELRLLK